MLTADEKMNLKPECVQLCCNKDHKALWQNPRNGLDVVMQRDNIEIGDGS